METPLYNSMNWLTKRRFTQKRFRYGVEKPYTPHSRLVTNLAAKFGMQHEDVRNQLYKERNYLISKEF